MVFWGFSTIATLAALCAVVAVLLPGMATLRLALGGFILFLLALMFQIGLVMVTAPVAAPEDLLTPGPIAALVTLEEIARLIAVLIFVGTADTPETFRERLALGAWFGLMEALSKIGGLFAGGVNAFCTSVGDVITGPCANAISATMADIAVVMVFHAALTAVVYRRIDTPLKALLSLAAAIALHVAFNMAGMARAGHVGNLELRLWELAAIVALVGVATALFWTREDALSQRRWQGR